jgi:hypothetical protein
MVAIPCRFMGKTMVATTNSQPFPIQESVEEVADEVNRGRGRTTNGSS